MDLRERVFRLRGFAPVPFLIAAVYGARYSAMPFVSGAVMCVLGEWLRIKSVQYAGGATRTREVGASSLVTSGPYGLVRNPLYLANMMIYIGFSLASGAWFPWLPLLALTYFTVQYSMIISLEQGKLRELFGAEYAAYCQKVPSLFPRIISRTKAKPPSNSVREVLREERSTLSGLLISWLLLTGRIFLLG